MSTRPFIPFFVVGFVVLAADLATKAVAEAHLAGRHLPLLGPLGLSLVYNDEIPHGSPQQWVNVTTIALMVALALRALPSLAAADRRNPVMLGLLSGAGLGNGLSLLTSPRGVVDFISLQYGTKYLVVNVADLAVAAGLVFCLRASIRLVASFFEREAAPRPSVPGVRAGHATPVVPDWVLRELGADPSPGERGGRSTRAADRAS
ncbi:MAG TPA: signal peptidase II [Gemmatimonadales bacterium]|nr:signal peptidase II [Gemmatimonadales bacterium]